MLLSKVIDALHAIENRHPGAIINVEIRDELGYTTQAFDVVAQYVFASKEPITVKFLPNPRAPIDE